MEWRVWGQVESRVTSEKEVIDVAGKILPGREVCVGRASSDFLTPNQRWSHKATIITIINKRTIKTNTHDSRHLRNCSYVPGTALDDLPELIYLIPNRIIWDYFFLFLIYFFFWSKVELQRCFNYCCRAKWSVIHTHILFFIVFYIMVYLRILNVISCLTVFYSFPGSNLSHLVLNLWGYFENDILTHSFI